MNSFAINGLFIAVAVLILVFVVVGLFRGFIKSVLSLCSFILAVVLTLVFAPMISNALCNNDTVMGWTTGIVSRVEKAAGIDSGLDISIDIIPDEIEDRLKDVSLDDIKIISDRIGTVESADELLEGTSLEGMSEEDLKKFADSFNIEISDDTADKVKEAIEKSEENKEEQPAEETKPAEKKDENGIKTRPEKKSGFIATKISQKIIEIAVYIALYLALRLILWIVCLVIALVRELPGVKGADMVLGALLGLVRALLLIGIVFFGFSIVYGFGIGESIMDMIKENVVLAVMYKYNAVGILFRSIIS